MTVWRRENLIIVAASAYYAVVTLISIYFQARTWKELHNAQPEIRQFLASPENNAVLGRSVARSYVSKGRIFFVLVCVILVVSSLVALTQFYGADWSGEVGVASYVQLAFITAVLAVAGYWLFKIPRIISSLTRLSGLQTNSLEPIEHPAIRELSVLFSKSGLRAVVAILLNGLPIVLLVATLRVEWFTWLIVAGVSGGMFIAIGAFALPQLAIHELAVKTMLRTKARIAAEVETQESISVLAALYKYQVIAAARMWAIDLPVLTRYSLALMGPALPLLFQLYIRGLVL
jgi:hypothetical protein